MKFERQSDQKAYTFLARKRGDECSDVMDSVHVVMAMTLIREASTTRLAGHDPLLLVYLNPHPRPSFMFDRVSSAASITDTIISRFGLDEATAKDLAEQVVRAVAG